MRWLKPPSFPLIAVHLTALFIFLTGVYPVQAVANNQRCIAVLKAGTSAEINRETSAAAEARHRFWDLNFDDQVSQKFKKGWDGELNLWISISEYSALKRRGSPLIDTMEQLGFHFTPQRILAPTAADFIRNYELLLDSRGIPEHQRIRPAVVFQNLSRDLQRANQRGENFFVENDFISMTPDRDTPPSHFDGQMTPVLNPRLGAAAMHQMVASGRFPILSNGVHDLLHLIVFAEHPAYAEQLKLASQNFLRSHSTTASVSRFFYALESLSLGDPAKAGELRWKMALMDRINADTSFAEIYERMQMLPLQAIEDRAYFWKEHFLDYVIHYGSDLLSPAIREDYRLSLMSGADGKNILINFFERSPRDAADDSMYNSLSMMPMVLESIMALRRSDRNWSGLLANTVEYLRSHNLDVKVEGERLLRLQLARMEYALWRSANSMTPEQWVREATRNSIDANSTVMQYLRDSFGETSDAYQIHKD